MYLINFIVNFSYFKITKIRHDKTYDVTDNEIMKGIWEVYHSWIDAVISDYNTDFYYQSRDYIAACYKEGEVL